MKDKEARQRIEQEEVGNMAIAERLVKLAGKLNKIQHGLTGFDGCLSLRISNVAKCVEERVADMWIVECDLRSLAEDLDDTK
jgi:hypothetical protein